MRDFVFYTILLDKKRVAKVQDHVAYFFSFSATWLSARGLYVVAIKEYRINIIVLVS